MGLVADTSLRETGRSTGGSAPQVLVCAAGGESWELTDPICVVGTGDDCHVRVHDGKIARQQCLIINNGRHVLLRDLHHRISTLVNGEKAELVVLHDGDRIGLGDVELTVTIDGNGAADAEVDSLHAPREAVLQDTQTPHRVPLAKSVSVIGRRRGVDVHLDDLEVSPGHAVMAWVGAELLLYDLRTRAGTQVNGVVVQSRSLQDGDHLRFGPFEVVLKLGAVCRTSGSGNSRGSAQSRPGRAGKGGAVPMEVVSALGEIGQELTDCYSRLNNWSRELAVFEAELNDRAKQLGHVPWAPGAGHPEAGELMAQLRGLYLEFGSRLKTLAERTDTLGTAPEGENGRAEVVLPAPPQACQETRADAEGALERLAHLVSQLQTLQQPLDDLYAAETESEAASPGKEDAAETQGPSAADAGRPAGPQDEVDSAAGSAEAATAPTAPAEACAPAERAAAAAGPVEDAASVPPRPQTGHPVNSIDLDPEVADKLRVLRRLVPHKSDSELLEQIMAEQRSDEVKAGKKKSWWRKG